MRSTRQLAASEMVRRARRRLTSMMDQVPAEGECPFVVPATPTALEVEEEAEETELLGRAYFFRTRLAGRQLLRAWLAWRA